MAARGKVPEACIDLEVALNRLVTSSVCCRMRLLVDCIIDMTVSAGGKEDAAFRETREIRGCTVVRSINALRRNWKRCVCHSRVLLSHDMSCHSFARESKSIDRTCCIAQLP